MNLVNKMGIVDKIKDDHLSSELKVALFSGAMLSYRQDSCLRPFPPLFVLNDGTRDVKKLVRKIFTAKNLCNFKINVLLLSLQF